MSVAQPEGPVGFAPRGPLGGRAPEGVAGLSAAVDADNCGGGPLRPPEYYYTYTGDYL